MYNIYIICKNKDIFNKKIEMFDDIKNKINIIQWIPSEFLKVTENNETELLNRLNTRYNTKRSSKISKLGCISAHSKALLAIINNQTNNNIILEEDASITNDLPDIPPNVSCYLGGWIIPPKISDCNKVKPIINNILNNNVNKIDYNNFKILMAHSYFIKNITESKTILLSILNSKKIKNYDVHLMDYKFFNHFYYPCIFSQEKHISSIDNKINKNHIYTFNYGL